jgi:acyl-coenzyme A thioesterase PaaI-like protein
MPGIRDRATRLIGAHRLLKLINLYPPYLGAGIRVTHISPDLRTVEVEMRLKRWNRNYVGTHFGGSLYSLCDPFFMLMLMENLGRDFVVWDKAATIRFLKPGRGRVHARFHLPAERIEDIRAQALRERKVEPVFTCDVLDEGGNVIAQVEKVLYVRRKEPGNS